MSTISEETRTEHLGTDTDFSLLKHHKKGLLTRTEESEDFAEFFRKLTKSTWFCEVAEA